MTCFHHTRKLLQMKGKQNYKRGQASGDHHAISRPPRQSKRVCTGDFQAAREGKWKCLCCARWAWTCCAVKRLQSYARAVSPRWTRAGHRSLHRALLLPSRERTLSRIPGTSPASSSSYGRTQSTRELAQLSPPPSDCYGCKTMGTPYPVVFLYRQFASCLWKRRDQLCCFPKTVMPSVFILVAITNF